MKRWLFLALLAGCGNGDAPPSGMMCATPTRIPARRDIEAVAVGGGKAIVYGGDQVPFMPMSSARQLIDEVWQVEPGCGNWTPLTVVGTAGPRGGYAAAYDAKRNRVVVFGGQKGTGMQPPISNEVWALDLASSSWTELHPAGITPPARVGGHMIYDAVNDRALLFGGTRSRLNGPALADLQELSFAASDGGAWSQLGLGVGAAPSPRYDAAVVLDPKRQLLLAFGGAADFQTFYNEVWAFDLQANVWRLLPATGNQPTPRFESKGVYDPMGDKVWLFGGHDLSTLGLLNDTWSLALDLGGTAVTFANVLNGDTSLNVNGVDRNSPERRAKHGLFFDAGKVWTVLGGGDCGALDDGWTLEVAKPTAWQPAVPALSGETCFRKAKPGQSCTPGTSMECAAPF